MKKIIYLSLLIGLFVGLVVYWQYPTYYEKQIYETILHSINWSLLVMFCLYILVFVISIFYFFSSKEQQKRSKAKRTIILSAIISVIILILWVVVYFWRIPFESVYGI